MESDNTQTVATFTGTLLKRQRLPGKPFVQLIFREAEQDWLCLSSNLKHVASLQIGKKYKIEGVFKSLGEHQYIHEPEILPIAREIKKRRLLISLGLGLGILLGIGGIVLAATHDPSAPQPTTPNTAQQTSVNTAATTPTTSDTTTTPPANPTPAPTTPPKPTPTPKPKTTPSTPAPAASPPASSTPSTPPADNSTTQPTTPPAPTPPAAPQLQNPVSSADGTSVTLTWSDSETPDHYEVWRDGAQIGTVLGTSGTSYIDSTVVSGQTYSYYVVAVNAQNAKTASNTASVTTTTPPPPNPTP